MFAFSTTGGGPCPIPSAVDIAAAVDAGRHARSGLAAPTPPGGFQSEAELAAVLGVEILPYGDLAFSPAPGVYAYSRIIVTRNLYRIPLP